MSAPEAPRLPGELRPVDWDVVARRQELEGEQRANLLRIVGVAAFYGIELLNFHGLSLGPLQFPRIEGVDQRFHLAISALCGAWIMTAAGVLLALRVRVFPPALKYLTTAIDVLMMTCVLLVADGPRSALVVAFPLLVALAGLRLRLRLIHFATAAAMVGYLVLVGNAHWFRVAMKVPRYHEVVLLLTIFLTGLVLDQVVRRVRAVASELVERSGRAS
jgi:hypothetical protein